MRKYLLPEGGNFYKANLHCHSTFSDGKKTPEEIKEIYQNLGYSIVAYTDHDILIPHQELTDENFLALNGFEMEINETRLSEHHIIKTCHICFIALDEDNLTQPMWHRTKYLFGNAVNHRDEVKFDESQPDFERAYTGERVTEIMNTGRNAGFYVTYNHPTWSRENYSGYINYSGMHAFEMFNGSCLASGFDDYNPRVYDDILCSGKKIFCIGADDNHNVHFGKRRDDSGWAFTVIKAPKLEYKTITNALLNGDFYASEGPEIYELWYEDGKVHVKCSDADRINCNYKQRKAETVLSENGVPVTEATFNVPEHCVYFRITVVDKTGKHATTNAYFVEDLIEKFTEEN